MAIKTIRAPRRRPSLQSLRLAWALALIAIGVATTLWWLRPWNRAPADPADSLLAQMQSLANGGQAGGLSAHALGGMVRMVDLNGQRAISASTVPEGPCVSVGWRLARTGTVIVNGKIAPRLTAAKLAEMCAGGATLTWLPNSKNEP